MVHFPVKIYPSLQSDEKGLFYVDDLVLGGGECVTFAESLEHAKKMAVEYLELRLETLIEEKKKIPFTRKANSLESEFDICISGKLSFVAELRWRRAQLGLSQQKAAKLIGIDPRNYQRIESIQSNPRLDTILLIKQAFGINPLAG